MIDYNNVKFFDSRNLFTLLLDYKITFMSFIPEILNLNVVVFNILVLFSSLVREQTKQHTVPIAFSTQTTTILNLSQNKLNIF